MRKGDSSSLLSLQCGVRRQARRLIAGVFSKRQVPETPRSVLDGKRRTARVSFPKSPHFFSSFKEGFFSFLSFLLLGEECKCLAQPVAAVGVDGAARELIAFVDGENGLERGSQRHAHEKAQRAAAARKHSAQPEEEKKSVEHSVGGF